MENFRKGFSSAKERGESEIQRCHMEEKGVSRGEKKNGRELI